MSYDYDRRTAAAEPMTAEDFTEEFERHLKVGDRQVHTKIDRLGGKPSVAVTLINLPDPRGAGGGAEAMNNRALFMTHFDQNPAEKIKVESLVSLFNSKTKKFRAKSGHPAQIAQYLADYINQLVKDNEPRFTHSH